MNSRFLRNGIVTLVLIVGTAALLYMFIFPHADDNTIPYSGTDRRRSCSSSPRARSTRSPSAGEQLDIELKSTDEQTSKPVIKTSLVPNEFATDVSTA